MSARTPTTSRRPALGHFVGAASGRERAIDAKRCTVQLSNGRLYLDVIATTETSLLGHDRPAPIAVDGPALRRRLSALVSGYRCIALFRRPEAAERLARRLAAAITGEGVAPQIADAADGDPRSRDGLVIAIENETLGRAGAWLASASWRRRPEIVIVGNALSPGRPFAAVLAEESLLERLQPTALRVGAASSDAASVALAAAVIDAVERQGLIDHGRSLADYLRRRLEVVRGLHPAIASLSVEGLSAKIDLAPPLSAALIRRRLCERGVLSGVDAENRLLIRPPLSLRLAEVDVVIGALRGALNGDSAPSALACCADCEERMPEFACVEA